MLPSRQRLSHQHSQEEFLRPEHLWRAEFPSMDAAQQDTSEDDELSSADEEAAEAEVGEPAEAERGADGDDEDDDEMEFEDDEEEFEEDDDVTDSESEILDWAGVSRFVRQCKLQQEQKAAASAILSRPEDVVGDEQDDEETSGAGNDWEIQMLAREMIKKESIGSATTGNAKNLSDVVEEEEEEECEVAQSSSSSSGGGQSSVSCAVQPGKQLCKQKSWAGAEPEPEPRTTSGVPVRRRDSLPVEDHIIEQFVHSTLRRLDKLEKVFTARTAQQSTGTGNPGPTDASAAAPSVVRSRPAALQHQHSLQDPSACGSGDPAAASTAGLTVLGGGGGPTAFNVRGIRRGPLYRHASFGEASSPPVGLSLLNIPLQPGPPRLPCLTSSLGAPLVPVALHHPPPLSPTSRLSPSAPSGVSPLARIMSTINEPMESSQLSDDASDYKNDEDDEDTTEMEQQAISGQFRATDEHRLPVQSPPTDDESLTDCIPECQPLLGSK